MNLNDIYNLSFDAKKTILKAIANGIIKKEDLNNNELKEIFSSPINNLNLVHCNCWGVNEYKYNGKLITKEKFERLEKLYNALFPDKYNVLIISQKDQS